MKKLFTALLLLVGLVSFSQSIGYFRYDSIRFEKIGGNAELILLNGTRNVTGGVLTNLGNGRTAFVTPGGGGGSGSPNTSVGAGFRIAINNTNNVKSVTAGYGITIDSATANQVNFKTDTSLVQPKNLSFTRSVVKNGITISLENDLTTPTDTSYYGYVGTKGWKGAALVNTSGGTIGQSVVWQGGKLFGLSSISGGASAPFRVQFRPGLTPAAPAAGDSIIVCDTFDGRGINVTRDGYRLYYGDEYTVSNDTIYVHPPFYANERVILDIYADPIDSLALCTPSTPPPGWTYLDYPTAVTLTESPAHVWSSTGANWGNKGLSATTITGDGAYKLQYNSSSDNGQIIGWNTANSNDEYTGYEYGAYLAAAGQIWRVNSGALNSTGGGGILANGEWVRLVRVSGTLSIEKSADGLTGWSNVYTYPGSFSGTLYFGLNVYQTKTAYYPQYQ